ncbi:zinc finger protein 25-like [Orussus abietinus]|uniref:zinc finger protein 25-like n=1 Tax=Orussus abietinus TaxID=222816 RepID=UPI000625AF10|nr:zinc finger protein 25-like [Orussus abietinus]
MEPPILEFSFLISSFDPLDVTFLVVKTENAVPFALQQEMKIEPDTIWNEEDERRPKMRFTCEICQKNFNYKHILKRHMLKHSNSRTAKCTLCPKAFKFQATLKAHMNIHNKRGSSWYSCSNCDFKGRTQTSIKDHYNRKHIEGFNFSCEQCGKLFKLKRDYSAHVKDHDSGPCVCDECGKSYPRKSSLYYHKRRKHTTQIKNFECSTCKKRFKTQKTLNRHSKLHKKKYDCEECGLEFKSTYGLTKHVKTHSDEKPYLCAICGKSFKHLSSQKIHLLTHVGERPYICDVCGDSFTQRSPMMLHRRKHPGAGSPPPPIKITNLLHGVEDKIIVKKSTE